MGLMLRYNIENPSEYAKIVSLLKSRLEDMNKFVENHPTFKETYQNDIDELNTIIKKFESLKWE